MLQYLCVFLVSFLWFLFVLFVYLGFFGIVLFLYYLCVDFILFYFRCLYNDEREKGGGFGWKEKLG